MTELERRLAQALRGLSEQHEREMKRVAEQAETLRWQVTRLAAQVTNLQQVIEDLAADYEQLANDYSELSGGSSTGV